MFVTKLRLTAGAAVLAVAALGAAAVVGQQPLRDGRIPPPADPFTAAQQPAGKATAPAQGKAPEPIPAKGIEDDDVPYATTPAPAVVRVEGGKLVVRQRSRGGVAYASPGGQTAVKVGTSIVGHKYDPADVLVFDMKGNRLAPKAWRAKFEQDQHVLVAWGGVVPNPRELVLFKDDTLVVVLPGMPAGSSPYGPVARTTYRAVRLPDGSYQYEPVTYYDPSPAVNELSTGTQAPYVPPAQPAPAAPATIPPQRRTAPAAPPQFPAPVPAPDEEPRPDRTT